MLELCEEALGVLNVEAAAVNADGKRRVERADCGLIVDGAKDEVVLAAIGLHTVGVGDGDVEDGVAGLSAEVSHEGEVELDLFGGGGVGQNDGGVGEVCEPGEGIARIGEDFEIRERRPVGDALDVEIGVFEDGSREVVGSGVLALAFFGEEKGEAHEERVGEGAQVGDGYRDDWFRGGRRLCRCAAKVSS